MNPSCIATDVSISQPPQEMNSCILPTTSNPHTVNNADKPQSLQLPEPQNFIIPFPDQPPQNFRHPSQPPMSISCPASIAPTDLLSSTSAHVLPNDQTKMNKNVKKNRGEKDREKEIKEKKNQIWQEREREWKLLQQQRQLENRKQQQQHQDSYINRSEGRRSLNSRKTTNKIPDWRKNMSKNEKGGTGARQGSLTTDQQAQSYITKSDGNDNASQFQTSRIPSSTSFDDADLGKRDTSQNSDKTHEHVSNPDRLLGRLESSEGQVLGQSTSTSFQMIPATSATPTSADNATRWTRESPRHTRNPTPQTTTPQTTPKPGKEDEHAWSGQQQQQPQQQQLQPQRQLLLQQLNQPTVVDNGPSSSQSSLSLLIPSVTDPSQIAASNLCQPLAAAHQLTLRPDGATPDQFQAHNERSMSANTALEQQQHQQQQQAEIMQREQRKQLVRAQQQQQEYLQMQFKQQQQLAQQQPFSGGQQPRQANQFTATSKEMPEIESEEEHQERLKFLYRQRQIQKQIQAQQYMMQQPVPSNLWVNNAQMLQSIAQRIPSDTVQQQMMLEQHRMSKRHDIRPTINLEKLPLEHQQAVTTPINKGGSSGTGMDQSSRFNFRLPTPNNDDQLTSKNNYGFPPPAPIAQSSMSISLTSTFTTPSGTVNLTSSSTSTDFSETVGRNNDDKRSNKGGKKEKKNSAVENQLGMAHSKDGRLPSKSVLGSSVFPGENHVVQHVETGGNTNLMDSEGSCVTLEEGNVNHNERRQANSCGPTVGERNEKPENENHITANEVKAKSLTVAHPFGSVTSGLQPNQTNQLLLPPPQVSLPPQQQHLILQAQQQQLLWQQAHAQLQHQYQIFYQQLQQLQLQLQQTQDPLLHQQVLRQQQQLQFLQTQILQHWQQGQIVMQQIHLQAFGLNALYNQMDPTQQKQIQVYQQELIRQQQQWAQQFAGTVPSGAADTSGFPRALGSYPSIPEEVRPQGAEVSVI